MALDGILLLSGDMESISLEKRADDLLIAALGHSSRRSAETIHGGHQHTMRQTLIALAAGHGLGEHDSPPEATLQVLRGRVKLVAGSDSWEGCAGDFLVIPSQRHSLDALDDSVVLLTVLSSHPHEA